MTKSRAPWKGHRYPLMAIVVANVDGGASLTRVRGGLHLRVTHEPVGSPLSHI